MRNRLIHNYSGVDLDVIWNIIYMELIDIEKMIRNAFIEITNSNKEK